MPTAENLNPPVLLTRDLDRNSFNCGVPALNDCLKKYALQNQKKYAARTYVATRGDRIVGYYSLAYGSVSPEEAPSSIKSGLPRHPVPVILLARLAVDSTEQGLGLGAALLKDA
ncbi:MAG TPA: GNAT family N-acetyltransferase, partial [Pyrinomonadaceae bacterium]|nr:GNAT family N-acetyltransferase [Pyrinomonadaceae bacterium]